MRFKEGDRVICSDGDLGTVKVSYMDHDVEKVVVHYDGYRDSDIENADDLERPPQKFYIQGEMCPRDPGDVPRIFAGPNSLIKDFTEGAKEYFDEEYDPVRGDSYQVNVTIELIRGD